MPASSTTRPLLACQTVQGPRPAPQVGSGAVSSWKANRRRPRAASTAAAAAFSAAAAGARVTVKLPSAADGLRATNGVPSARLHGARQARNGCGRHGAPALYQKKLTTLPHLWGGPSPGMISRKAPACSCALPRTPSSVAAPAAGGTGGMTTALGECAPYGNARCGKREKQGRHSTTHQRRQTGRRQASRHGASHLPPGRPGPAHRSLQSWPAAAAQSTPAPQARCLSQAAGAAPAGWRPELPPRPAGEASFFSCCGSGGRAVGAAAGLLGAGFLAPARTLPLAFRRCC